MPDNFKQIPLVGRTEELRAINSMVDGADGGSGTAVLMAGEGGVGKTRLINAVAERAAKKGWAVAIGRAYPVETGVPYAAFSDALLPMLRKLGPSGLSVLTRGGAAELRSIFPSLDSIGTARSLGGDDPAEFKARMLWNFSQLLGGISKKQPLLLALENLQWADASSLELFHFVARNVGQQRVMLLGTYNELERDKNPVLKSTEQSLQKIGAASLIRLDPLGASQVSELIQKTFGVDESVVRNFSALLYGWTRGNPFFVEEILKTLTASGRLKKTGDTWSGWEIDALELPSTVRDAIGARIERLSPAARDLAAYCAVLGTRATYETLSHLSGLSSDSLVDAIEELQSEKVIEEISAENSVEYDFAHPLLQQVIYSTIGHARAKLLHASVAASLERTFGTAAEKHANELAFHYSRAPGSETDPKAIRYLHIAGRDALSRYANREAAGYLTTALERIDALGDSGFPASEKLATMISLARARQRNGDYEGAVELWTRSRDAARASGDLHTIAVAEHRMGLAAYWSANFQPALAHFNSALEYAAPLGDEALIVRIHLARAIALQDIGRVEEAKSGVEKALVVAEAKGDVVLLARVHRALLLLYAWTGPKAVARAHGVKALEYSEASGDKMLEWTAHWGMSVLSGLSSDADGVARHLAQAEKLSDEVQSPILRVWTAEIAVQYNSGIGEWDLGISQGERAIALARGFGQRALLPRLLVWTGLIYLWRGDLEKSRGYIEEAWALSRASSSGKGGHIFSIVPAHHGMASFHMHTRDFASAIAVGEAGLAIADNAGYAAWALQWLLPVVGESALYAKDWERTERHSRRMRVDAERLDHPLGLAWADACDGLLIMLRDNDPGKGSVLLRKAAATMDQLQIPGSAALVRRHLGRALIDSGDRELARQELRRSHDVLARLGANSELEAVREQLRELGSRPPAKSVSVGAGGLTGRELEIARMVAERKSNKEIGTALDISARTVSTHLSNIFLKLGVASRGALTDFVRNEGLQES